MNSHAHSRLAPVASEVSSPAEVALVERAALGQREAVEELIERFHDTVYSMALSLARDRHRAEDLAQEAWIRILKGLPGFRRDARLSSWIYRIVLNTYLNSNRRQQPIPSCSVEQLGDYAPTGGGLTTRLCLRDAVRSLPRLFREVVVLRYAVDLSYKEIAAVLGLPLGTVQSRLKRGLTRLARCLDPRTQQERSFGKGGEEQ